MDRTPWFAAQNITTYDLNNMSKDPMKGLGWFAAFILGQMGTRVWGFGPSQTVTPSLSINLNEGQIYALAAVDSTPIGTLAADAYQIIQQGWVGAQSVTVNTSGLGPGQSQVWLIQCEFFQADVVRVGDPTYGVRGFWNASDPSNPLIGINGLGGTIPTVRQGKAKVTAIAGTPATTGTETVPAPSSGCVPLYKITLNHGQSAILTGQIELHPDAPFIAGLLNSHHKGIPGHAPKIQLAGFNKEVQGIAEMVNLPVTNQTSNNTKIPTIRIGTASPVGVLEGVEGDLFLNKNTGDLWRCTATGDATTATWSPGTPQGVTIIDTFPATITASAGTFALKLSNADAVVNLPSTAQVRKLRFIRYDSTHYNAILTPATGAEKVLKDGMDNATMILSKGESCDLESTGMTSPNNKWLFS